MPPDLEAWGEIIRSLRPAPVGIALVVLSLFLALENHRIACLVLLAQYGLFALLLAPQLYTPVVLARLALALGICGILYITAAHMQRATRDAAPGAIPAAAQEVQPTTTRSAQIVRALFNLPALALGGLLAYSLWRAYPLALVPPVFSLASYWIIGVGLMTTLVSSDPLRRGIGLLLAVSGGESLYLSLEQGLLVMGLLSIVDVMLALAVVYTGEVWLEASRHEGAAP